MTEAAAVLTSEAEEKEKSQKAFSDAFKKESESRQDSRPEPPAAKVVIDGGADHKEKEDRGEIKVEGKNDEDSAAKDKPELSAAEKAEAEKELQRKRSLDGIVRSKNREIAERDKAIAEERRQREELAAEREALRRENEELKKYRESASEKPSKSLHDRLINSPEMERLAKEYQDKGLLDPHGVVLRLTEEAIAEAGKRFEVQLEEEKKKTAEIMSRVNQKLEAFDSVAEREAIAQRREELNYIREYHPDAKEFLIESQDEDGNTVPSKLDEWIESKATAKQWRQIRDHGSPEEVVEMFALMKKEIGVSEKKEKPDNKDALSRMESVKSKHTPKSVESSSSVGKSDADSFRSSFESERQRLLKINGRK
jgi:hypothetical protein